MGSGGGGANQVQKQEVTTTNLPAYLQPYVTDIAQRAQGESNRQYTPYANPDNPNDPAFQRIAGFTDAQKSAQNTAIGMQRPDQYGAASDMATRAGLGALDAGKNFTPGQFNAQQVQGPQLQNYQMQGPKDVAASQLQNYQMAGPDSYTGDAVSQYMSPYMQQVVDVQKQQAVRDAKIGQLAGNLGAARQGTYGGARQLLASTERERNLGTQMGQIQATGSQNAFQNAQAQFNEQQKMQQGANQQNLQANLQTQGLGSAQALQAALANQQMGYNVGNQNLQANLQTQQLGSGQNMQAQLANQQYGMDAQKANEMSRQFGANLGLQGYQAANQAAQNLGNLGTAQQTSDMQRMQAQSAAGKEQQGLTQQGMDQRFADFMRQQNFPQEQLSYYSNLVRGLPQAMNTSQTTYAAAPSMAGQLAQAGLGAAGLYQMSR